MRTAGRTRPRTAGRAQKAAFSRATNKEEYIKLAGTKSGWDASPPGSRTSTYSILHYQSAAKSYAALTLKSINAAAPKRPTVDPVPYTGVQYVRIPEFTDIGDHFSQQVAGAIASTQTVRQAIEAGHVRPTRGEQPSGGQTDAGGTTGDQRGQPGELVRAHVPAFATHTGPSG